MIEFQAFARPFRITIRARALSVAIAAALSLVVVSFAAHADQEKLIIAWGGNASEWNQKLHVNSIRMGCSSAPSGCFQAVQQIARQQHVNRVFLAILLTESSVNFAQQYSALSATSPVLYSVGFDDFVSQVERLHTSTVNAASRLDQFTSALKSANPGLHFGVTIYEDELSSPIVTSSVMANVRNRTDFVHLFIHYRQNGPKFPMYVQQAKALFPNAQIIAGAYPVDRIDYLPCSRAAAPCTPEQEISLFEKAFDLQMQLLHDGSVSGVEFYPGYLGDVSSAPMWKNPRSCRPGGMQECISISQKMQQYVAQKMFQSTF